MAAVLDFAAVASLTGSDIERPFAEAASAVDPASSRCVYASGRDARIAYQSLLI
ncbi:hypothetical protein [Candidatus Laterigemmans baculatus]|uniref:hypothetical protein n=1 Tax=Candidatus Laterigemmans baculatus TaxID=2770505 RepID=UPI0013D9CDB1|nr:hypothetical protein [Candidatus Laterigemmans baculatus]